MLCRKGKIQQGRRESLSQQSRSALDDCLRPMPKLSRARYEHRLERLVRHVLLNRDTKYPGKYPAHVAIRQFRPKLALA